MEGLLFLVDIVLMLLLAFAVFRAERKPASEDLGMFSYKIDPSQDQLTAEDNHSA